MAQSRRDEVLQYNWLSKSGQELYKLILVTTFAEAEKYQWNFPFVSEWNSLIYVLFGEAVDKVTKLVTKDELFLRQMGGGSVAKGVLKELVSTIVAGIVVGVPTYFLLQFYAKDLLDASESDNKALRNFATLLLNNNAAKPIIGTAAYLVWRLIKIGVTKTMDCCITPSLEHIVRYPNLNFFQIVGRVALNGGMALGAYGVTDMALRATNHSGLADNPHIAIATAVGGYLLNVAGYHLAHERIEENVPKENREIIITPGPNDPIEQLDNYEGYRATTGSEQTKYSAIYTAYNAILMGLATGLFETINACDKDHKLNNIDKLLMVIGFVCAVDLFVRSKDLVASVVNFVGSFFTKPTENKVPVMDEHTLLLNQSP